MACFILIINLAPTLLSNNASSPTQALGEDQSSSSTALARLELHSGQPTAKKVDPSRDEGLRLIHDNSPPYHFPPPASNPWDDLPTRQREGYNFSHEQFALLSELNPYNYRYSLSDFAHSPRMSEADPGSPGTLDLPEILQSQQTYGVVNSQTPNFASEPLGELRDSTLSDDRFDMDKYANEGPDDSEYHVSPTSSSSFVEHTPTVKKELPTMEDQSLIASPSEQSTCTPSPSVRRDRLSAIQSPRGYGRHGR